MTKNTTCDWCKRTLSKSKMRKPFRLGIQWKCDPKGDYKNAIQCHHLYDDEIFFLDDVQFHWIKPADRVSFAEKEIEKADRWLAEGELDDEEHHRLVWYIKEISQ